MTKSKEKFDFYVLLDIFALTKKITMNHKEYKDLDILKESLRWNRPIYSLDDSFIVADNLDHDFDYILDYYLQPIPYKLPKHIVIGICEGEMVFNVNIETVKVSKGSIFVMQTGSIGQLVSVSKKVKAIIMFFDPEFWPVQELQPESLMKFTQVLSTQAVIKMSDDGFKRFVDIYLQIKNILQKDDYSFKKLSIKGYLQVLMADACQITMKMYQTLNNQNVITDNTQRIFQKYISEVRQNYIKERTIEFYASKLCVSPKYLGQMVMKASGRSALSWINDYIILEAKALLKSKRYNVQEVSFMLNFANPSFFGKFFKSKTGVTPREYMIG